MFIIIFVTNYYSEIARINIIEVKVIITKFKLVIDFGILVLLMAF